MQDQTPSKMASLLKILSILELSNCALKKSTKALCDGRYWPTALLNLHVFIEWEIKTRGYSLGTATQRLIHAGHQISIKY
jgi:hypothetical protein